MKNLELFYLKIRWSDPSGPQNYFIWKLDCQILQAYHCKRIWRNVSFGQYIQGSLLQQIFQI